MTPRRRRCSKCQRLTDLLFTHGTYPGQRRWLCEDCSPTHGESNQRKATNMSPVMNAPAPPEGGADFAKLTDYVNRVVIFFPMEEKQIDTPKGTKPTATVTQCVALVWTPSGEGKVLEIGTVTVFWGAVRAQLHDAVGTNNCVVGELKKEGQRYELKSVTDELLAAIEAQLTEGGPAGETTL